MATDDKKSEGAGGAAQGGADGGKSADRGERSSGKGGAPPSRGPSSRELESALANMDPARLAALVSIVQAKQGARPATPKISHTLDQLSAEQADQVIKACDDAMEEIEDARARRAPPPKDPTAPIREVNPEVVAAMVANSSYRGKPIEHSIDVARRYLRHKHGDDTKVAAAG